MSNVVPGPFSVPPAPGSPTWKRPCPSCAGELVDLSFAVARDHVEQAWEQDKKRRDKIAVIVSAPLAVVGLIVGVLVSMVMTAGTNRIGVFNIAIPLVAAGMLFTLSSRLIEHLLPAKARDPDMSLAEIEKLEQIRRAEDRSE
jgi:ABC-type transport system involved in cytochrome bd biosynthesis fused ATPase/permease subunit